MAANQHEINGADCQRVEQLAVLATTRGLDQLTTEEEAVLASAVAKPANKELLGASEYASRVAAAVAAAITSNELPAPSAKLRAAVEAELNASLVSPAKAASSEVAARTRRVNWYEVGTVLTILGLFAVILLPGMQKAREAASRPPRQTAMSPPQDNAEPNAKIRSFGERHYTASGPSPANQASEDPGRSDSVLTGPVPNQDDEPESDLRLLYTGKPTAPPPATAPAPVSAYADELRKKQIEDSFRSVDVKPAKVPSAAINKPSSELEALAIMPGGGMVSGGGKMPDGGRVMLGGLRSGGRTSPYYLSDELQAHEPAFRLSPNNSQNPTVWETERELRDIQLTERLELAKRSVSGEAYAAIRENAFRMVRDEPLSTFSIDVDTASYANVRRFLTAGQLPPKDAVRIEELLNYFSYDYPQPQEKDPFSVNMEVTECPWRPENRLLRVGLKGRDVPRQQRPASNLVFLIDVSGSMQPENKLPLLKTALRMLVQELTENDRVSIVTYAGDAGLKLPSTNGTEQSRILSTIDSLTAGGSTNGSAGIELAYEQATGYFIRGGANRVILLTDGDLNVGITDDEALVQLIQRKAKTGVFLTVLGVGDGNLKDSKMEKLADHGNGLYAYLDGVREARKVLVEQMSGSLVTIAKDVKLQIEFNPGQVQAYRLVGYENRVLANRDFHDDTKDAGEIGAGHTVTALYELVPTNAAVPVLGEPLKYQSQRVEKTPVAETPAPPSGQASHELLTLKLRFKYPEADRSELRDYPLLDRGGKFGQASTDFRFASSVAMFGLVLRDSQYRGSASLAAVEEIATSSLGQDPSGYRSEFVDLVRKAEQLK